jgi:hypothetical protein
MSVCVCMTSSIPKSGRFSVPTHSYKHTFTGGFQKRRLWDRTPMRTKRYSGRRASRRRRTSSIWQSVKIFCSLCSGLRIQKGEHSRLHRLDDLTCRRGLPETWERKSLDAVWEGGMEELSLPARSLFEKYKDSREVLENFDILCFYLVNWFMLRGVAYSGSPFVFPRIQGTSRCLDAKRRKNDPVCHRSAFLYRWQQPSLS